MTEHTVTVEKTVEEDETVYTCDYCGLGDDAGEMIHYTPDSTDGELAVWAADQSGVGDIPAMHFHVSCIPKITASEEQAESITLASQYNRRTGDSLLFVVTGASLFILLPGLFFSIWGYLFTNSFVFTIGAVLLVLFASLSRKEAKNTLREFST